MHDESYGNSYVSPSKSYEPGHEARPNDPHKKLKKNYNKKKIKKKKPQWSTCTCYFVAYETLRSMPASYICEAIL